jgi:hypothetical protein
MFKKIKLGSTLAALIIFAFPWVEMQCSERVMVTQSGFQVIHGDGSVSEEMEAMEGDSSSKESVSSDKSLGFAPLVALALIAVIGALVFSFIAVFRGSERADMLSSVLPAAALLLLVTQLMVGFPAKKNLMKTMSEGTSEEQAGGNEFGTAMDESMAATAAMMMNIRVKATPAFYLELLALGIPTLLLVNGLIDKYKKGEQGVALS